MADPFGVKVAGIVDPTLYYRSGVFLKNDRTNAQKLHIEINHDTEIYITLAPKECFYLYSIYSDRDKTSVAFGKPDYTATYLEGDGSASSLKNSNGIITLMEGGGKFDKHAVVILSDTTPLADTTMQSEMENIEFCIKQFHSVIIKPIY